MAKVLNQTIVGPYLVELVRGECRHLDTDGNVIRYARVMEAKLPVVSDAQLFRTQKAAVAWAKERSRGSEHYLADVAAENA